MDDQFLRNIQTISENGEAQALVFDGVVARVAVDRFCSMDRPTEQDKERFAAVMMRAIERTDEAEAARIANTLAAQPNTPPAILARLTEKGEEAAIAIAALAPGLPAGVLQRRAEIGGSAEATTIARRSDLDAATVAALARRPEGETLRALIANRSVEIERGAMPILVRRGRIDIELGRALLERGFAGASAEQLFLSADTQLRRKMILEAQRAALAIPVFASPLRAARAEALEAAMAGDANAFASAVALRMRTARDAVRRMVADEGGEPLGLLFAATGVDASAGGRALCTLKPNLAELVATGSSNVSLALNTTSVAAFRIAAAVCNAPFGSAQTTGEFRGKPGETGSDDARRPDAARPASQVSQG